MKKLLYCAAALATLLFAGSCQRENLEPAQESAAVTFTVEAPAALQTRAIADGLNVNELIYEVWLTETLGDLTQNAQRLYQAKTDMAVENGVNKATLTLDLVNDQKFTVLFWAQVKEAAAYTTDKLTEVTYAKNEYNSNDESLAAFYAVAYVNDSRHVEKDGTTAADSKVSLRRPFAQLNLGTLNTSTAYTVTMVSSEVKVTFANKVFNVATSVASGPAVLTFKNAAVPADPATLSVNGTAYQYAAMNYLFAGDNAIVEYDIVTKLNGGMDGTVNNIVDAVPLKENYRTNIIGNLLTSKTDYEIVVDAAFNEPDEDVVENATVVKTADEFKAALYDDKTHINIYIDPTYTRSSDDVFEVEVNATSENLYWGGASTKTINIDANGYTISFKNTNGDWNNIRCKNDAAVIIIKNAHLTNTGNNNGPWNRHDITFRNAVELYNVTSDKAIALENDSKLVDVEISDVHPDNSEAYGLWISAKGQTVDLDGVTITPSENKTTDRAIKIADQYLDSPAKVTLSVENSTFVSQKKAAILVTSKAGAVINWGRGNDITGVAADPANAVWVDGGQEYQNIEDVTVTGASVIIEGQVSSTPVVTNAEELKAAIAAAGKDKQTVILLKAGTYTGVFDIDGKNVALIGEDGVVIDGLVHGLDFAHILLRNITLTNATPAASSSARHNADYYCLGAYVADITIEDCVFDVNNSGNAAGKGAINIYANRSDYKTSEINGVQYDLVIRNTTFNCNGERPIRGKTNSYIDGCTFNDQHRYAIQVQGNSGLATETVTFINNKIVNPCSTSGEAFAAGVSISKSQILEDAAFTISGNTLESTAFEDLKFVYDISDKVNITTCTLNGEQIATGRCASIPGVDDAKEVVMDYTEGHAYAMTNDEFAAAIAGGATDIHLYPGNYTMPEPDLRGKGLTIIGSKDVEIDATAVDARDQFVTGATLKFEGVTLNFGIVNYMGFANTASLTYKDCDINGLQFLFGENVVFENCSLDSNGAEHTVWTYGVKNVSFTDCDFTYGDRGVNCYSDNDVQGGKQTVNFTKCTFATENIASEGAVEINSCFFSVGIEVNMEGCTAPAYGEMAYISPWDSTNGAKTTINIK